MIALTAKSNFKSSRISLLFMFSLQSSSFLIKVPNSQFSHKLQCSLFTSKILHFALCLISLGMTVVPRRNCKQCSRQILFFRGWGWGGGNNVYYGLRENGE